MAFTVIFVNDEKIYGFPSTAASASISLLSAVSESFHKRVKCHLFFFSVTEPFGAICYAIVGDGNF